MKLVALASMRSYKKKTKKKSSSMLHHSTSFGGLNHLRWKPTS